MYHAKETLRKNLETKVAEAMARPVLAVKGETVKVSPQEMLATLEAVYGKKG